MSELVNLTEFFRQLPLIGFAILLGVAIWRGWIYIAPHVTTMERAHQAELKVRDRELAHHKDMILWYQESLSRAVRAGEIVAREATRGRESES